MKRLVMLLAIGFLCFSQGRNREETPEKFPDKFYEAYALAQGRQHSGEEGPPNRPGGWPYLAAFVSPEQRGLLREKAGC